MTASARRLPQRLAARWIGEREVPIGGVAADRRLLRRGLQGPVGRVLVVGPSTAVRQALRDTYVDVAGTSAHATEITVCSTVEGRKSLPAKRWNTVIITEPAVNLPVRLRAVYPACLPGARLVLLQRNPQTSTLENLAAVAQFFSLEETVVARGRSLFVARAAS